MVLFSFPSKCCDYKCICVPWVPKFRFKTALSPEDPVFVCLPGAAKRRDVPRAHGGAAEPGRPRPARDWLGRQSPRPAGSPGGPEWALGVCALWDGASAAGAGEQPQPGGASGKIPTDVCAHTHTFLHTIRSYHRVWWKYRPLYITIYPEIHWCLETWTLQP